MPDGEEVLVCQTTQYGYYPFSNTATLTVEAPSTTATVHPESTVYRPPDRTVVEVPPAKTPEELQAEAEQEGWLDIGHEFLPWWQPPWFLLHVKVTIGENVWIHVAFNPALPFWPGIVEFSGLETLLPALPSTPQPREPPSPPPTRSQPPSKETRRRQLKPIHLRQLSLLRKA